MAVVPFPTPDDELDFDFGPPAIVGADLGAKDGLIVSAVCHKIEGPVWLAVYRRHKLFIHFQIFEPEEYSGKIVKAYFNWNEAWKRRGVPRASKLHQFACVAMGRRILDKHFHISKGLFLRRAFKLKTRLINGSDFSVVDSLVEAITGPNNPAC